MSTCVFTLDILKSWFKLITLYGSTCSKKRLTGRSFSEHGFIGSRVCKPWQEFKGSALKLIFCVVLRLNEALVVHLKYHIKASVAFGRGKSNHTLARCVFMYQ